MFIKTFWSKIIHSVSPPPLSPCTPYNSLLSLTYQKQNSTHVKIFYDSLSNKFITQSTFWPKLWGPFSSSSKLLSSLCSDLALFIFRTLLADIPCIPANSLNSPTGIVLHISRYYYNFPDRFFYKFYSSMASKPIDIHWIRTGYQSYRKVMYSIELQTMSTNNNIIIIKLIPAFFRLGSAHQGYQNWF